MTPPAPDDFTLGPAVEFMRCLWRLNHTLERLSRRMETVWGVTAQQRLIIRCIGKYPGMTAGQLARQFHVDAGTVSIALRRLERRGLIERRRVSRDRRRLTLGLTPDGRAVDKLAGTSEHAVDVLLQTIDITDVDCTRRVLDRFAELLELVASNEAAPVGGLPAASALGGAP